jgi:fucose 4-O-acetylase-like acetyltransferase
MLSTFNSEKFRFWSFVSMALLVFVHGYNLEERYLQPWSMPPEALTWTTFTEYFLANGILRFRIPMLFLISGYLFAMHDQVPHKTRVMKRVRTLLVPYLLWSALCLLLFYGAETFSAGREWIAASHVAQIDRTRAQVHEYRWYEFLIRWILAPLPYQLWFIRVLFFYNFAYPLIRKWVTEPISRRVFFSVSIFLWLSTGGFFLFEGEGLLFFSLGVWMQKVNFDIDKPGRLFNPRGWALVFVSAATVKTLLAFDGLTIIGNAAYPAMILLHKLTVFSGLVSAWFGGDVIVRWCMSRAWFVWLTSFSFIIYAVHAPWVAIAIDPAFDLLARRPGYQMLTFIFLPLSFIAFAILLGATLRKVTPAAYGLLTGGRGI